MGTLPYPRRVEGPLIIGEKDKKTLTSSGEMFHGISAQRREIYSKLKKEKAEKRQAGKRRAASSQGGRHLRSHKGMVSPGKKKKRSFPPEKKGRGGDDRHTKKLWGGGRGEQTNRCFRMV